MCFKKRSHKNIAFILNFMLVCFSLCLSRRNSICLLIYLSCLIIFYQSVCTYTYLIIHIPYLYLSVRLSVPLSANLSDLENIYLFFSFLLVLNKQSEYIQFMCISNQYLYLYLSFYQSFCPSMFLFQSVIVYLYLSVSICYQNICPSIYRPSIYLSIHNYNQMTLMECWIHYI